MGNSAVQQIRDPEIKSEVNTDLVSENIFLESSSPVPKQKIISGWRRIFVRLRIRSHLVSVIFKNYHSVFRSIKLLRQLLKFRRILTGESVVMKYAEVDKKLYLGLYTPGFKSHIFDDFILGEVSRVFPLDKPTNALSNVLISITKKCALRCEHCFEWETLNGEEKLSLPELQTIVSKFQEMGTGQIHFSGGEPMQRFADLIELIKSASKKSECWVLTSGYNLTAENAQKLKSVGLTGVVVSIDHFIPEVHNQFRGSSKSFMWAQQAVRNAISAKLITTISVCATRTFISNENLFSYAEMAKQMGVSFIQVFEPRAAGHYLDKDVELTTEQQQVLEDYFFTMNQNRKYRDYPIVAYHGYYQRRLGCFSSANRHVYVDSDGDIRDCPFCRTKAGNALTGNIPKILHQLKAAGCSKFKPMDINLD